MTEQLLKKEVQPDKHIIQNRQTHAQTGVATMRAKNLAKVEAVLDDDAWDAVLRMVAEGTTQTAIAAHYRLDGGTLSLYLGGLFSERAVQLQAARKAAAHSLADRALEALTKREGSENGVDASIGRDIAKHYQWRAAMADRKAFSERPIPEDVAHTQAAPSFSITILTGSASNQTVTIQQDADLI